MAVIVTKETPHRAYPIVVETWYAKRSPVSFSAIKIGWAMRPTRRSDAARLQSIIMCGVERMEGVLTMAANTKALPRMDMSIIGALRTQFMMIIVLSSFSEWSSADPLLCLSVLIIINFQQTGKPSFPKLFLLTPISFFPFPRKAQLKAEEQWRRLARDINTDQ